MLADLASGNFKTSPHAYTQSKGRSVTRRDIIACAKDPFETEVQENGRFAIHGLDEQDDDLTIIAAYDEGTLVVTVIRKDFEEKTKSEEKEKE